MLFSLCHFWQFQIISCDRNVVMPDATWSIVTWSIVMWSNVARWIVAWSNVRSLVKDALHRQGSNSSRSDGDLPLPCIVCCVWRNLNRRRLNRFYESIVFVSFVVLHLLSSLTAAAAAEVGFVRRRSRPRISLDALHLRNHLKRCWQLSNPRPEQPRYEDISPFHFIFCSSVTVRGNTDHCGTSVVHPTLSGHQCHSGWFLVHSLTVSASTFCQPLHDLCVCMYAWMHLCACIARIRE